ncbi:MAG: hypothetical protein CVV23_01905 [Ignavibacteriae bacterium HGW-Ignavibacteriae-2]|jgi:nucleotide-binding universal stress UspA family protein|nr:MAG: hypothetical protein CVV23_01905 [Ignavibacteriae bacterium HGW-Ignavibacteriae-2]
MFKKIGLAIAFSPSGINLLKQAAKMQLMFNAELYLIHVGKKESSDEEAIENMLIEAKVDRNNCSVIWKKGDPAKSIIKTCQELDLNLLIMGALEKEPALKYYIGSVARKIMRQVPCSLLILKAPVKDVKTYKIIGVQIDYSSLSEKSVRYSYELAVKENTEKLILIREFKVPGLTITVYDSGSIKETQETRNKWIDEESLKMEMFVNELNLTGIPIEKICLYGKAGWESTAYLKSIEADLFVLPAPKRKLEMFDRIFQHDLEYVIEDLPCDLLIIKN